MKAAVLHKIGEPLRVEDVPVPQVGPDAVLVETRTCGLCRTDVHIQDGLAYVPELPHIPGHEPAGVIADLGAEVSGLKIGQRVAVYLFDTCGQCYFCRAGRDAQCTQLHGLLGVTRNGGFAEYFVTPAKNVFPLPDTVPFEIGGLTSCAVITAVHAFRRSRLGLNDVAVVMGSGGVAQPLIQILAAAGVRVVAVSRSEAKLDLARRLGARLALRADQPDLAKTVQQFAGEWVGAGVQCAFDCVGLSSTMKEAASYLMRGGQLIVVGEEPEFPEVDTIQIAQRELEIIGSRNGSRQDFVDSLSMLAAGIISPPISREYPLEQINEALEFLRSGRAAARIIVRISE